MITDIQKFKALPQRGIADLSCDFCLKPFQKVKKDILRFNTPLERQFCCHECKRGYLDGKHKSQVVCDTCGKVFMKRNGECAKSKNNFCNHSCAATFTNTHKTKGCRRSKLEAWLEQKLQEAFPTLSFSFNQKDAINSELDIYIPDLKLAFELNGIFHYEPIYGMEKLYQTKSNDSRKFRACFEKGISLCIIDTSGQKYFKESTSQKYLDIIANIINQRLAGS